MTPEKFNEFEKAMDEENREMVKALLHESPGLIETRNDKGETPLHIVLRKKSLKNTPGRIVSQSHPQPDEDTEPILRILLPFAKDRGVIDSFSSDETDRTPLYVAIEENRPTAAKLLLDHGADPWAQTKFSGDDSNQICRMWSPISYAFSKNSDKMAKVFITFYQSLLDPELRGRVRSRRYSDLGKDLWGDLLHSAAAFASAENLRIVNEDILNDRSLLFAKNDKGELPLHSAVRSYTEAKEKFRLLYDYNAYDSQHMGQALTIACQVGATEVVQIALQDASNIARNATNSLILATKAGNMDIVKLLLDKDITFLKKKNEKGDTAVHVAVKVSNKIMLRELLKRWASSHKRHQNEETANSNINKAEPHPIFTANEAGENPLTLAIKANERPLVKMLLEKGDWKALMRNGNLMKSVGITETPLRLLICQMPDMARLALGKCREVKYYEDGRNDEVEYTIEFVNDTERGWYMDPHKGEQKKRKLRAVVKTVQASNLLTRSRQGGEQAETGKGHARTMDDPQISTDMNTSGQVQSTYSSQGTRKLSDRNHVLNLLVDARNMDLLDHPVVKVTIRHMGSFARNTFMFSLLTYSLFLALLTTELFMMDHNICYGKNHSMSMDETHGTREYIVTSFLLVVACLDLVLGIGIVVLYWRSEHSLMWSVSLQCFTYIYAIIHIIFAFDGRIKYEYLRYSFGVLIFLGWLNLMILTRRLPVFGIYVIMFWNICVSFVKFSLVFTIMLVAFAMSFYALFCHHRAFKQIGWALMKTGVMMTGELDYGSQWVDPGDDEIIHYNHLELTIAIFMYSTFLILMTILLMNMLVGLAVNDIAEVQRYSKFTVLKLEVEHATKYKHNLVRRLWKLCYGAEYAKPENAPTITLSREKEMIMMGDLNPIMYRWGGWRGKVTRNFERRSSPQSHMIDHGHDNNATNIELVEMNYHCSA